MCGTVVSCEDVGRTWRRLLVLLSAVSLDILHSLLTCVLLSPSSMVGTGGRAVMLCSWKRVTRSGITVAPSTPCLECGTRYLNNA